MIVQVGVPAGALLFQGNCSGCEHTFGVLASSNQVELVEVRPKFCPFCAGRTLFQRLQSHAEEVAPTG